MKKKKKVYGQLNMQRHQSIINLHKASRKDYEQIFLWRHQCAFHTKLQLSHPLPYAIVAAVACNHSPDRRVVDGGGALRGHCYVHAITSPGQRLIVRQRRFNQGPSFSSAILRRRPSECSTSATNRRRTNFRDRKTKKLNRKTS